MFKKYVLSVLWNNGFTLAEVLITLGIIGVVAALTIPTLQNVANDVAFKTGLKKSYTILNQAYARIRNDNGGSFLGLCTLNDSTCLVGLFKPYLKYNAEVSGTPVSNSLVSCWDNQELANLSESHVCLLFNDGMSVDFDMENANCDDTSLKCAVISVDVNGLKKPNFWGKDRYKFCIWNTKLLPEINTCQDGIGSWTNNLGCSSKYLLGN